MGVNQFKPRTKLGRWLDSYNVSQTWLVNETGMNRNTISGLCSDDNYEPREDTQLRVVSVLRRNGYDVRVSDFW